MFFQNFKSQELFLGWTSIEIGWKWNLTPPESLRGRMIAFELRGAFPWKIPWTTQKILGLENFHPFDMDESCYIIDHWISSISYSTIVKRLISLHISNLIVVREYKLRNTSCLSNSLTGMSICRGPGLHQATQLSRIDIIFPLDFSQWGTSNNFTKKFRLFMVLSNEYHLFPYTQSLKDIPHA